ncbi:hypothetical protein MIND_01171800 [Mycena indigotica]|uniref:Hemerythrin-like domain-containing protein n=1 Tax=Mycena indigotica TaxID=2126181 RepID=A0A8H6S7H5_9AGAR|nr:uncharacterized protein MIND_01171800 [Mycena indigotica]KAF7292735.1 hypothetical protein MIND_01171800 [Mycena indigotica]
MVARKIQTLTHAIREDHQEMYEYYENYQKSAGDLDAQARWARQLTWEIARHAVAEEIVVYPLMEELLGDEGKRLADHDRAEHQRVKESLSKLESLTPGTTAYDQVIDPMMVGLRHHNNDEETKDLPLLEPKLDYREEGISKNAATDFMRTKKFVPTRGHPGIPNKPPFETLVGFMMAPVDKLKDAFAKFPTEEMEAAAERDEKH